MSVPLPAPGGFVAAVRASCKTLREASGIRVDTDAISRLLVSPTFKATFSKLKAAHGVVMPLKFPNVVAELNLISILSLLNFGSGFRLPLHKATGRGAYDNIRALVFSLYLTSSDGSDLLSAKGMRNVTRERVAELLNFSLHVEQPHETIQGLVVGKLGGPLLEFAELVAQAMKETGDVLVEGGYPDLGSFVLEALKGAEAEGKKTNSAPSAETVVERLVTAIPAFQDMALVSGQPVYVFKKALFVITAITLRFSGSSSVPIPDSSSLPIYSDNVIPSMLVYLGVLDLSSSTIPSLTTAFSATPETTQALLLEAAPQERELPKEGPALTGDASYALRAAAVDACEIIVAAAKDVSLAEDETHQTALHNLTLPEIDAWLWSIAKERNDFRGLPRFADQSTLFF